MNLSKYLCLLWVAISFTACIGDRKAVNVSEINDTGFVNQNFKGNLIHYFKEMSACENMSASDIASMYQVSQDMVVFEDISKSDRRAPNSAPICTFFIKDGESDFQWLRGSMNIQREIGQDETAYDVAKAAGNGVEWQEAWALNKSISKSSEWIKDMGLAAVWNERKTELKIKFEGYTLSIYPLKNRMNTREVAKNRNYKEVAIAIAKAAGYIN